MRNKITAMVHHCPQAQNTLKYYWFLFLPQRFPFILL